MFVFIFSILDNIVISVAVLYGEYMVSSKDAPKFMDLTVQ